ncbi:MAG: prolipoprotein diacylglyceryl transferase [Clostridia bacterium]|nr:prolipoprotein diacylglyceryl transferase [Clostridia bacterium]
MNHWVAFPRLGIEFPLPQSLFEGTVFGMELDIRFYGVCIATGFLLAMIYAYVRAPKLGVDRDNMIDVVLVATVVGVLCARLYYVIFHNLEYYLSHPEKILAIWDGGLAIYGGILGGFLAGFIMCRIKKVSVPTMFDLAAIGFLIGQGIGRWGNFFNQEAYGRNTDLPWGMTGDIIQSGVHGAVADQTAPVHPTFLYESLWCLLGVLVMHLMFTRYYKFRGQIFASYIIWYGAERMLVESLRADSLYVGPFRVSQLVAIASVLSGVTLWVFLWRREKRKHETDALADGSITLETIEEDE